MDAISFMIASISLLVTPGPTNTLLATAGAADGMHRSLRLLAAELAGYIAAILFLRVVAGPVIAAVPEAELALRVMVSVYLLYLAFNLWQHGSTELEASGPVTFGRVLLTTFLNPKAIIFAFTILPLGVTLTGLIAWLTALGVMISAVGGLWIALGAALSRGLEGIFPARIGYRLSALALMILAGAVGGRAFL